MNKIPESSLVLSPLGNIYHLDIQPSEIADTIILVGDPVRAALVSQHFNHIECRHAHREFLVHTGEFEGKRLSVVSTGIGTDNIDIVLNELDALVNIDLHTRQINDVLRSLTLIRLGTSGALHADIPLGDFIISTHGIDFSGLAAYYDHTFSEEENSVCQALLQHSAQKLPDCSLAVFKGNAEWIARFSIIEHAHLGMTVTCNGFYAPQGRALRGALRFPEMLQTLHAFEYQDHRISNLEMETAGIYALANLLGHKSCSISAVVANRATLEFTDNVSQIESDLIVQALALI